MNDQLGLFSSLGKNPLVNTARSPESIPLGDVQLRGKNRVSRISEMGPMAEGEARKVNYTRFAYRLETKRVKEPDYPYDGLPLDQPLKVVSFAKSLEDADIEKLLILYLNTKNRLVCLQFFAGTLNKSVIYPREIIKHAILAGSAAVIIVHNHPSGDPSPSPEDRHITGEIVNACRVVEIQVLDHIIIGTASKYFSFCESRMMP